MNIIEKESIGKKGALLNEDCLVVTEQHVAVIDGSTSKGNFRVFPEESNGRTASRLTAELLSNPQQWASQDQVCDVQAFCQHVTALFRQCYEAQGVVEELRSHGERRMTASAAIYSDLRREVWMIGDCQVLIDGRLYTNPKPGEEEHAQRRARLLRQAIDNGATVQQLLTHDTAREHIVPSIIEVTQQQNKTFSVIDGFDIPLDKVVVIKLDDNAHEIVLATDGYPRLMPTLSESERYLQDVLKKDPLMMTFCPQTKGCYVGQASFDDRTFVRFRV